MRVGFENLTRVADFDLVDRRSDGPGARSHHPRLADRHAHQRVARSRLHRARQPRRSPARPCCSPKASSPTTAQHSAYLLGKNDKGPLSYISGDGTNPTDCAFLPNGDLLVLERGVVADLASPTRLVRIPAADVKPGAQMTGEVLLEGAGGDIDNMEGLAVHTTPDGETRITLISDNNFNDWERNLLLEFSLPE